jgi:D-beta-D-heptose 7-phosphate kinase / D-beta-D-heptose 1-phosphate adenosyltransferase
MKADFSHASVLVIGDLMIDKYFTGSVKRISPEAPVPVVNVKSQSYTPGGAANVANNLSALRSRCFLIGAIGRDENGAHLEKILDDLGIGHSLVAVNRPTITKIRVVGNHQQIVRLDFEEENPLEDADVSLVISEFEKQIASYNIVVLSDYGKGLCTPELCKKVIAICKKNGVQVIVDPKKCNWEKYSGATIITPNVGELSDACGSDIDNSDEAIISHGQSLKKNIDIKNILVTRSEKGMTLIGDKTIMHIQTEAQEVYDVSGAGDTVVATLAASLSMGNSLSDSIRYANTAAGIAVGKLGTAPVSDVEIAHALSGKTGEKILPRETLIQVMSGLKKAGKKIVFTNGCFDILHKGHISYLRESRSLGDILILGLNSDASVKRLKGPDRPINNEADRAEVLSALEYIDYITIFDEDTPHDLIKSIAPDILVKGGDYKPQDVVGREFAAETVIIKFVHGYSTSKTIDKMKIKK